MFVIPNTATFTSVELSGAGLRTYLNVRRCARYMEIVPDFNYPWSYPYTVEQ
jgi:hypothetical protein